MPTKTIRVPAERRDDLLRELLLLYGVKTDAVHSAIGDYLNNERSADAVLAHRAELAAIDALIEQLGWRLNAPPRAARLFGDPHLLAEIGRGALGRAVDELGESLSLSNASVDQVELIGRAVQRIAALFGVVRGLYPTD